MKFNLMLAAVLSLYGGNLIAGAVDNLADELVRLRGEVEELQGQLDLEKEDHRNRMAALTSQVADLGVEERRQNVNLEKMQQTLVKFSQSQAEMTADAGSLSPVLQKAIEGLYDYVSHGLPFKQEERLGVLTKMRSDLDNQLIEPKRAVNRLWAFVEDEIRLSKENGIYRQTIDLNGEQMLADVAKLGSMMLYFQTSDRKVGMAKRDGNGEWRFVELDDNRSREQIVGLFDTLKKQIRQGYFELPNPLGS